MRSPGDTISAIPPPGYGERFLNFIRKVVMSPEEAAKEKERKDAERAAAEADLSQQQEREARETQTRSPEPERRLGTIRSPSAERTNGESGTILPVVEETGEGSIGSRTRSANDSATDVTTHRERPTSSMSNLDKPLPHRPDSMPPVPQVQQFSYVDKQTARRAELTGGIARISS